jgi:prepilin-type N-terminal cleavage/methylation domain-containing protein
LTNRVVHPGARGEPTRRRVASGFTLAELLVAIAIIAVIAVLTVVAVGAIADDARLASGTNAVSSALDTARALAMRKNRLVLVVFRPRFDGREQVVEAVTAEWTGDAFVAGGDVYDRFQTIPDVAARALPVGIQVAGPYYRLEGTPPDLQRPWDAVWVTQSSLPAVLGANEAPGELIGVMYGPDGTVLTRNPQNDSLSPWVDFNRSGQPDVAGGAAADAWLFDDPADETLINLVPFLAVYDDGRAREIAGDAGWSDASARTIALTDYISERADRIHFNRYTGVVMR